MHKKCFQKCFQMETSKTTTNLKKAHFYVSKMFPKCRFYGNTKSADLSHSKLNIHIII